MHKNRVFGDNCKTHMDTVNSQFLSVNITFITIMFVQYYPIFELWVKFRAETAGYYGGNDIRNRPKERGIRPNMFCGGQDASKHGIKRSCCSKHPKGWRCNSSFRRTSSGKLFLAFVLIIHLFRFGLQDNNKSYSQNTGCQYNPV